MTECQRPGCTGGYQDFGNGELYCDVCGLAPVVSADGMVGSAATGVVPRRVSGSGSSRRAARDSSSGSSGRSSRPSARSSSSRRSVSGRLSRSAAGHATARQLSVRSSGSAPAASGRNRLGAGLVTVPEVPRPDPRTAVLSHPQVPERKRFCSRGDCGAQVGRSRGDRPGRTEGYCTKCGHPYSFVPKLRTGDIVHGQYEVAGCLAHGGLGWIYLAVDRAVSDRWVVLKGLLDTGDEDALAAAVSERRFLAEIEHSNIVRIYNFVEHLDQRTGSLDGYIVMEYVGGKSLKDIANERRTPEGRRDPLPVERACAYGLEALEALGHLHSRNLLYCDFKVDNAIQQRDQLKLIDMGAVRRMDDEDSAIYGTVGYQAPEVAEAGPSVASDLYTVARTLAVLTFDFQGYTSHYADSLPDPETVEVLSRYESFYRLLVRATDPDPGRRFASAEEMAEQLTGVLREVVALQSGRPRPALSTLFGPELRVTDTQLFAEQSGAVSVLGVRPLGAGSGGSGSGRAGAESYGSGGSGGSGGTGVGGSGVGGPGGSDVGGPGVDGGSGAVRSGSGGRNRWGWRRGLPAAGAAPGGGGHAGPGAAGHGPGGTGPAAAGAPDHGHPGTAFGPAPPTPAGGVTPGSGRSGGQAAAGPVPGGPGAPGPAAPAVPGRPGGPGGYGTAGRPAGPGAGATGLAAHGSVTGGVTHQGSWAPAAAGTGQPAPAGLPGGGPQPAGAYAGNPYGGGVPGGTAAPGTAPANRPDNGPPPAGTDGGQPVLAPLDLRATALALPVPRVDPRDPNAGFLAGLLASAPTELLTALAAAPGDSVERRLRELRALLEMGAADSAGAALARLERGHPDDWRIVWYRGLTALVTGDRETAALAFDAVYDAFPGEPAPKLALGVCAEVLGQLDNAAEYYHLVWATDPSHVSAAFGLARVRMAAGDREGAVRALESVPEASIHYTAARVAAVRARLRSRAAREPLLDDLTAAARQVERLREFGLDAVRREQLSTEVLGTALDWVLSGRHGARPDPDGGAAGPEAGDPADGRRLLGRPLDERGLRLGLERSYRVLARLAQRGEERIELVERANRLRPRTWV